jgi:hypothetical protein
VSLPAPDKFWKEYRIYDDRIELETVLGVMTIPFDEIDRIEHGHGGSAGLAAGTLVIDRKQGWIRRVCVHPREVDGFRRALETALSRHRRPAPDP